MTDSSNLRPLEFGELFGRGFELTRRTFSSAGVISIILYVLIGVVAGLLFKSVFTSLGDVIAGAELTRNDEAAASAVAMNMLSAFAGFIPLALFALFAYPFMITACTTAGWEATNDNDISIGELISRSIGRPMWHIVAQYVLLFVAYLVLSFALSLIMGLFVAILGEGGGRLVSFAFLVGMVYLGVCLSMASHKIVIEGRGPIKSLGASFALVKGNWWRVAGVFIILIIGYYALTVVIALVFAGSMMSALVDFASLAESARGNPSATASLFANFASVFPLWIFVVFGALGGAFALVMTNMLTAIYTDLRARRGEFQETDDELDMI